MKGFIGKKTVSVLILGAGSMMNIQGMENNTTTFSILSTPDTSYIFPHQQTDENITDYQKRLQRERGNLSQNIDHLQIQSKSLGNKMKSFVKLRNLIVDLQNVVLLKRSDENTLEMSFEDQCMHFSLLKNSILESIVNIDEDFPHDGLGVFLFDECQVLSNQTMETPSDLVMVMSAIDLALLTVKGLIESCSTEERSIARRNKTLEEKYSSLHCRKECVDSHLKREFRHQKMQEYQEAQVNRDVEDPNDLIGQGGRPKIKPILGGRTVVYPTNDEIKINQNGNPFIGISINELTVMLPEIDIQDEPVHKVSSGLIYHLSTEKEGK